MPKIPACDVLVVGGDNCPDFPSTADRRVAEGPLIADQREWFLNTYVPWVKRQNVEQTLLTWGNHDYLGTKQGLAFDREFSAALKSARMRVVVDTVAFACGRSFFLTPWSVSWRDWAFTKSDLELAMYYSLFKLPPVDVVVAHQPPYGVCDLDRSGDHYGSHALLEYVEQTQPTALVCGHVHNGRGVGEVDKTTVYNVAILDDTYHPVYEPVMIEIP